MASKPVNPRQRAVSGAILVAVTLTWALVNATDQHVPGAGWLVGAAVVVGACAGVGWAHLEDPSPTSDSTDAILVGGTAVVVLGLAQGAESIWGEVALFWLFLLMTGLGVAMMLNFLARLGRAWEAQRQTSKSGD